MRVDALSCSHLPCSLALAADRFEHRRGRRTVQTLYQATNATKSELRTVRRQQTQHQLYLAFSSFPPYNPRKEDGLLLPTSQTMAPGAVRRPFHHGRSSAPGRISIPSIYCEGPPRAAASSVRNGLGRQSGLCQRRWVLRAATRRHSRWIS
jgi:hypothetical protein